MKKIKYWKSIGQNLSLKDALKILDSRCYNNLRYDRIGIKLGSLGYKIIDQYDDYKNMNFNIKEITSDLWEVVVPDIDEEKKLTKVRDIIKNEHFLNLTDEKIDNMDISDIWKEINNRIVNSDNDIKYRIIKSIVENKLYKKS